MTKLISKFALLIVIVAILALAVTGRLISSSPLVIAWQLSAVALGIWARRSFKKGQFSIRAQPVGGSLLSTGPYRFIRHPMYTFALAIVWSSTFGHYSLITVLAALIVTIVIAVRIATEEGFLRTNYTGYAVYSRTTKMVIPFVI